MRGVWQHWKHTGKKPAGEILTSERHQTILKEFATQKTWQRLDAKQNIRNILFSFFWENRFLTVLIYYYCVCILWDIRDTLVKGRTGLNSQVIMLKVPSQSACWSLAERPSGLYSGICSPFCTRHFSELRTHLRFTLLDDAEVSKLSISRKEKKK